MYSWCSRRDALMSVFANSPMQLDLQRSCVESLISTSAVPHQMCGSHMLELHSALSNVLCILLRPCCYSHASCHTCIPDSVLCTAHHTTACLKQMIMCEGYIAYCMTSCLPWPLGISLACRYWDHQPSYWYLFVHQGMLPCGTQLAHV